MNQIAKNYNSTMGLQNLVIERNPISNIVFEISEDGIMEHYAGVDKEGKIFSYDKKSGNDAVNTGIHRESYNGLTNYYKSLVEDTSKKAEEFKDKYETVKTVFVLTVAVLSTFIVILITALIKNAYQS